MREIQASEAKAHFCRLLDDVARGATVIIMRHRRAIARLVPEMRARKEEIDQGQEEIDQAVEAIHRLRMRTGKLPLKALLSDRHAGHKY